LVTDFSTIEQKINNLLRVSIELIPLLKAAKIVWGEATLRSGQESSWHGIQEITGTVSVQDRRYCYGEKDKTPGTMNFA
jgi:hypothetical protein